MMKEEPFKFDEEENENYGEDNQFFGHRKRVMEDGGFANDQEELDRKTALL